MVSDIKYEKSILSKEESCQYKNELLALVKSEKVYRVQDITLNDLAGKLSIPRNTLSRVINEEFGQNFYDFINSFRIDEIKEKLKNENYKEISLFRIAMDVGFNSKATFNAVFKKQTGQTPSYYRKNIQNI